MRICGCVYLYKEGDIKINDGKHAIVSPLSVSLPLAWYLSLSVLGLLLFRPLPLPLTPLSPPIFHSLAPLSCFCPCNDHRLSRVSQSSHPCRKHACRIQCSVHIEVGNRCSCHNESCFVCSWPMVSCSMRTWIIGFCLYRHADYRCRLM